MDKKQTITVSCHLKNLQMVRDFVRAELLKAGTDENSKNQIVLAVDEICTNLIIHSNQNDSSKEIELSLNITESPKGVSIEFVENGIPFDYNSYQEPNLDHLKENKIRGRMGLILARRIMDKIEYLQVENNNVCRLFKAIA